jgi:hypothetical protein
MKKNNKKTIGSVSSDVNEKKIEKTTGQTTGCSTGRLTKPEPIDWSEKGEDALFKALDSLRDLHQNYRSRRRSEFLTQERRNIDSELIKRYGEIIMELLDNYYCLKKGDSVMSRLFQMKGLIAGLNWAHQVCDPDLCRQLAEDLDHLTMETEEILKEK